MTPRIGLLIGGLTALLIAMLLLFEPYLGQPAGGQPAGPPTLHSSGPGGVRALALWLDELGYDVVSIEGRPFAVDDEIDLLFALEPRDVADAHAEAIVAWVARGGRLVLADRRPSPIASRLGADVVPSRPPTGEPAPLQPLLLGPLRHVETAGSAHLALRAADWVPLLGWPDRGEAAAALRRYGAGSVALVATPKPFTTGAIGQADNAAFALRLLADVPPGATVAFDEYHHGLTEHGTLGRRLLSEPWGWALLYAAAATFAFLVLAGRRFGPARPDPAERPARGRGEYVAALAAALRESDREEWLRRTYVEQVKRRLGRRFRVAAGQSTPTFVAAIAARRPEARALAEPLARLESGERIGDAALVDLLRRADAAREALEAR